MSALTTVSPALRAWLRKLRAEDAAVREQALDAIALLGEVGALPALAATFARDPDPHVRQRARQVARAIYLGALHREAQHLADQEAARSAAEALRRAQKRRRKG